LIYLLIRANSFAANEIAKISGSFCVAVVRRFELLGILIYDPANVEVRPAFSGRLRLR
jgi:hypothetical protein